MTTCSSPSSKPRILWFSIHIVLYDAYFQTYFVRLQSSVLFQLNLLLDRVEEALADFEKCVSLNPEFAVAQVQKCYTGKSVNHLQEYLSGTPTVTMTFI